MLRFVCAALFALALVMMPAGMATQYADQARAEATGEKAAPKGEKKAQKAKKKRERSEKQKAASARQKQCGAEYREAKKAGKLAKGQTWRAFNRDCLARLKGKS
jgi:ABC-type transporter MlaC component